jgi:hypothetical protein
VRARKQPREISERYLDGRRFRLLELRAEGGGSEWELYDAEAISDDQVRAKVPVPVVARGTLAEVVEYLGKVGRLEQADPNADMAEALVS